MSGTCYTRNAWHEVKWIHEWTRKEGKKKGTKRQRERERERGQEGGREELTGVFKIKQSVTGKRRILTDFFIVSWWSLVNI